jgi:hypothetical protein
MINVSVGGERSRHCKRVPLFQELIFIRLLRRTCRKYGAGGACSFITGQTVNPSGSKVAAAISIGIR